MIFEDWLKSVNSKIQASFEHKNFLPRIKKIVINAGVGVSSDKEEINNVMKALQSFTGQKPVQTRAKKSITSFSLREGMPIGCKITLRGKKISMLNFKLVNLYLPSVRNFAELSSSSFDSKGSNYNIGLPSLNVIQDNPHYGIRANQGLQIVINFSSKNISDNKTLLSCIGFPFKN